MNRSDEYRAILIGDFSIEGWNENFRKNRKNPMRSYCIFFENIFLLRE